MYELMFGHGCINLRIYPKALKYLYAMASIFFLFMLSFFYIVRDPLHNIKNMVDTLLFFIEYFLCLFDGSTTGTHN